MTVPSNCAVGSGSWMCAVLLVRCVRSIVPVWRGNVRACRCVRGRSCSVAIMLL